ncbi:MAG: hypothetical protein LQ348_007661 [Seirophora lacunosa]|nr:MAG: hypothetical protein LQ348_007661 [Seirophora lacunosa]
MPFDPEDVTSEGGWWMFRDLMLDGRWLAVVKHPCSFPSNVFIDVIRNLIRNPNINSSLLFRADILYDDSNVLQTCSGATGGPDEQTWSHYSLGPYGFPRFELMRTIVRRLVPRNPQLDRPITQTCQIFQSGLDAYEKHTAVIYTPHVASRSEIPWYHPNVRSVAYLHTWHIAEPQGNLDLPPRPFCPPKGTISVHYRLFPDETLPLSDRLLRTAHHLLSTLHKHGQGTLNGYTKRVHHDQVISQSRAQDTYTRLKAAHAKRLCDHWAEQTDSSKHVFEDLGIASFLIELWKDMYKCGVSKQKSNEVVDPRPEFPGFVDIGCGNGVLVDVLVREGYRGWGFDARNRKSWAIFEASTQRQLEQMILVPQPLLEMNPKLSLESNEEPSKLLSKILFRARSFSKGQGRDVKWHNGIFPEGTFVISNHADELTPWTPLLAFLSSSPFLMIPCCSHNLSGLRFRAPSKFNGYSADKLAPPYFASNVTKSKSVAITVPSCSHDDEQPRSGSLKDLQQANRSKQPSAYAALCDWVSALAVTTGYEVEKEMLRLPSTRNTGLVGRNLSAGAQALNFAERLEHVRRIVENEGADGTAWVERARCSWLDKGKEHGSEVKSRHKA